MSSRISVISEILEELEWVAGDTREFQEILDTVVKDIENGILEMVKKEIIDENIACDLLSVDLCTLREWLYNITDISCEDCEKLGLETCEIECSIPCEDCKRHSLCHEQKVCECFPE